MVATIEVTVDGFPPVQVSHANANSAFIAAWNSYTSYDDRCSFRTFMTIAKRRKIANPPGVGEPIRVLGRRAWTLEPIRHTTRFVYDGERVALSAHHSEIERGH